MLQNMGHTGGILGRRAETDVEHFVLIVIGHQRHSGSCLFMSAQIGHTVDIRDLAFFYDLICFQILYFHMNYFLSSPAIFKIAGIRSPVIFHG